MRRTEGRMSWRRGAEHPKAVLTEDQAKEIIRELRTDTPTAIAKRRKINPLLVARIKHAVTWKHLPRSA